MTFNASRDDNFVPALLGHSSVNGTPETRGVVADPNGNLMVGLGNSGSTDAFSRLRVSTPNYVFDGQLTYDLQPLLFEQITAESGATVAHDATNRMALLTFSSTPNGGKSILQTFEHFRYTAGRSQLIFITFNFVASATNTLKFAGYSDGTEGVEFQLSGTTKQFMIRSTTTNGNQTVTQANWNIDPLDGTGPSGVTLDITKTQILVIDLQALYVGRVRVGFDIDGQIMYAHEFLHANTAATPYLKTANLPLRIGMTCTGAASTTMNFICCSVIRESDGTQASEGYFFSQGSGAITAGNGARTHALSLQPRTTFNSIVNRAKFELESLDIANTGSNPVQWELCIGDVITGTTTFTDVNTTYSTMAYNTAGTTSGAPTVVIASGYIPASVQSKGAARTDVNFKYPICLDAAGAARVNGRLTLLLTGIGGTSVCYSSMTWKEIR